MSKESLKKQEIAAIPVKKRHNSEGKKNKEQG